MEGEFDMKRKITKAKIIIKQNWFAITILLLWFLINYFVFLMLANRNFSEALAYTFYYGEMTGHPYGFFYPTMSGFLIFGLILTLITVELYRKYHPEQTCLALSQNMSEHAIIIGFSHLGQRIREYLIKNDKNYVVIEDDEELVSELIEDEQPVVTKRALEMDVLEDASVSEAKLVVCTKNDLEILVVATNLVRDVNQKCKIVCRCFDDSLAKILEKQLGCETISTSKYASEVIIAEIDKFKVENLLIIGCNNTARRLLKKVKERKINYKIIEKNRTLVEDLIDEEPIIIGDAKDRDLLEKAGTTTADLVLILIDAVDQVLLIADAVRELNKHCDLICRFFHEELAEILEKPPFNALVISTSKNTLEKLIEDGVFDEL